MKVIYVKGNGNAEICHVHLNDGEVIVVDNWEVVDYPSRQEGHFLVLIVGAGSEADRAFEAAGWGFNKPINSGYRGRLVRFWRRLFHDDDVRRLGELFLNADHMKYGEESGRLVPYRQGK